MPFIDCKITKQLAFEQKDELKSELGKLVGLLHKPESYLMVGIADGYDIYFAGNKVENGAYISVDIYGTSVPSACENMTKALCDMLKKKLNLDPSRVYITYRAIADWGWNGANF